LLTAFTLVVFAQSAAQAQGVQQKSAPAAESKTQQVNALCEQGKKLARAGKLAEARAAFKKATEVMPDNPRGWDNLARISILMEGDAKTALIYFGRALSADPNDICAGFFVGLEKIATGDKMSGRGLWEHALTVTPKDDRDWFFRGRIFLEQKQGHQAEDCFKKAIALSPHNPDYCYYLAFTYNCMHKVDLAERGYIETLKADPRNILALSYLGIINMKRGNLKEAESLFRKALAIEPRYDTAYINLANIQIQQGHKAEAEQTYIKAIQFQKNDPHAVADAWLNIAMMSDDMNKRFDCLNKAIKAAPRYAPAQRAMGIFYSEHKKDPRIAESYFRKAIAIDPTVAIQYANLGMALCERKDFQQAKLYLEKSIQMDAKSPVPWNVLAVVHVNQNEIDKAEECLNESVKVGPRYYVAWSNLGIIYRQKGKNKEAEAATRKALQLEKEDPSAWNNLALLLLAAGKTKEAEDAFKKCMALAPDDPENVTDLAKLYLMTGRKKDAEKELRHAISINADYGPAWQQLSTVLLDRGDKAGARDALAKAVNAKLQPNDLYRLGYSLESMGEKKAARQAYSRGLELQPEEADVILNMPDEDAAASGKNTTSGATRRK
jgi:Flp pilus assembly protein TadD